MSERALPTLEGGDVTLRPLAPAELPILLDILTDPTVARWWGAYDFARVEEEYGQPGDDEGVYLIVQGGEVAGLIQFGEETDPHYSHASIDIALSGPFQGRGIGRAAIRALAKYLFGERGHHRLTIDPACDNANAIKAYERAGFRTVGIMREYERGPDGSWHDNLLMELLAREFR